jgi:DNA-binding MarR family transcriptional regulator
MADGTTAESIRRPVDTSDRARFFPFFISSIANKISRGGSRVYLRLFGVGIIEWRILYVLAGASSASANAICQQIDLDKAAASRSIQVLERRGYVTACTDPCDARRRTVSLTPAGAALHDQILKVALQREQYLLDGFSDAERDLFLSLLRRMHVNAVRMDRSDYGDVFDDSPKPTGADAQAAA